MEQPPVFLEKQLRGFVFIIRIIRLITEEYLAKRTLFTWQLYLGWQYDISSSFHCEITCSDVPAPGTPEDLWGARRQKDAENSKRGFMREGPWGMPKTGHLQDTSLHSPHSDPVKGNANAGTRTMQARKSVRGAPPSQRNSTHKKQLIYAELNFNLCQSVTTPGS